MVLWKEAGVLTLLVDSCMFSVLFRSILTTVPHYSPGEEEIPDGVGMQPLVLPLKLSVPGSCASVLGDVTLTKRQHKLCCFCLFHSWK